MWNNLFYYFFLTLHISSIIGLFNHYFKLIIVKAFYANYFIIQLLIKWIKFYYYVVHACFIDVEKYPAWRIFVLYMFYLFNCRVRKQGVTIFSGCQLRMVMVFSTILEFSRLSLVLLLCSFFLSMIFPIKWYQEPWFDGI